MSVRSKAHSPDWDAGVSELLGVPKRPYSTELCAAIELVEILRKRRIAAVLTVQEERWGVEFRQTGRTGWDSWPIGATGSTLPEAVVRAGLKLGTALEAAREQGHAASRLSCLAPLRQRSGRGLGVGNVPTWVTSSRTLPRVQAGH